MDGVHDMGGEDGFGAVVTDDAELISHEPWEVRAQVVGLVSGAVTRDRIERLDPATYLGSSYYARWLKATEAGALQDGLVDDADLARWRARLAEEGDDAMPRSSAPEVVEIITSLGPHRHGGADGSELPVGTRVRVRRSRPRQHHRCPRYLRGAAGEIEKILGRDPVPSYGEDLGIEACYTVRFDARDLFGPDADHTVLIDLWEHDLEPLR